MSRPWVDRDSEEWQRYAAASLSGAGKSTTLSEVVAFADALWQARRRADEDDKKIAKRENENALAEVQKLLPVGTKLLGPDGVIRVIGGVWWLEPAGGDPRRQCLAVRANGADLSFGGRPSYFVADTIAATAKAKAAQKEKTDGTE